MVKEIKYDNGLTFLYEELPLKSISFDILVRSGSAYENENNYGVAHFLEHTLFKGTKNRSEFEIAKDLEERGIGSNASTSKTYTMYYVSSTAEQFEDAVEILSDMFFHSIFDKKGHDIERKSIIEEYNSKNDRAKSKVALNLIKTLYSQSCYEISTLGTRESIDKLSIEDLQKFYSEHYTANNVVVSFSGGIPFEKVKEIIEKYIVYEFKKEKCEKIAPNYNYENKHYIFESKDINQTIMDIAYVLDINDLRHYRMIELFKIIFSSGMNSRLFERLRNQLGLCYSVYGSVTRFKDFNSSFIISIQANQENEYLALKEINAEIEKICNEGITRDEFKKAYNIAYKSLVFENEDYLYRAIDNAIQYNTHERVISIQEEIDLLNSVKYEELNNFCKNLLKNKDKCISIISKKENEELKAFWMQNL